MDKDLKLAKEIFFYYGGSHYQMLREGDYEKYKKYNISKEVEKEWIKELFLNNLNDIKNTKDLKKKHYNYLAIFSLFERQEKYKMFNEIFENYKKDFSNLTIFSKLIITRIILENIKTMKLFSLMFRRFRVKKELRKLFQKEKWILDSDLEEIRQHCSLEKLDKKIIEEYKRMINELLKL